MTRKECKDLMSETGWRLHRDSPEEGNCSFWVFHGNVDLTFEFLQRRGSYRLSCWTPSNRNKLRLVVQSAFKDWSCDGVEPDLFPRGTGVRGYVCCFYFPGIDSSTLIFRRVEVVEKVNAIRRRFEDLKLLSGCGKERSKMGRCELLTNCPWIDIPELCKLEGLETSFDAALRKLKKKGLTWLPWVGKNYAKGERILFLSESDYAGMDMKTEKESACCHVDNDENFIRKVIAHLCLGSSFVSSQIFKQAWKRTAKLTRIRPLRGPAKYVSIKMLYKLWSLTPKGWEECAYMDIVQHSLDGSVTNKSNLSKEEVRKDLPVVERVVQVLKPKLIICASRKVGLRDGDKLGGVPVVVVNHPSCWCRSKLDVVKDFRDRMKW